MLIMNSLQRAKNAIHGKNIDCIPTFPILIAPACQIVGVKQGRYSQDPDIMADTLIEARELS